MSDNVVDSIMQQYEQEKSSGKGGNSGGADLTNYFAPTVIDDNEQSAERTFRILPAKDGGSPFTPVWFHEVYIDGKKRKIYDPSQEGKRSPLNEVRDQLKQSSDKNKQDLASRYQPRKFWICKGIDKDKPKEGVKFWRIKHNLKGEGIYDKIVPLFKRFGDLTDPYNGRDLIISVTRNQQGYVNVTNIIPGDKSALSEDKEQIEAWLADEKIWSDVYKNYPVSFLEIVAQGKDPVYDKNKGDYVPKGEENNDDDEGVETSVGGNEEINEQQQTVEQPSEETTTVDDSDLPF